VHYGSRCPPVSRITRGQRHSLKRRTHLACTDGSQVDHDQVGFHGRDLGTAALAGSASRHNSALLRIPDLAGLVDLLAGQAEVGDGCWSSVPVWNAA